MLAMLAMLAKKKSWLTLQQHMSCYEGAVVSHQLQSPIWCEEMWLIRSRRTSFAYPLVDCLFLARLSIVIV